MNIELNKIAGAALGTLLFTMVLTIASDAVYAPKPLGKAGYDLPSAAELPAASASTESGTPSAPLPVLLAKADIKKGEANAKACTACHNFREGRRCENRAAALRGCRPGEGQRCRFRLLGCDEAEGWRMDLRGPRQIHCQSEGLCSRHENGLCRREGRGQGRRHRGLPPLAIGHPLPLPQVAEGGSAPAEKK